MSDSEIEQRMAAMASTDVGAEVVLSPPIGALLLSADYSDVCLVVEGVALCAHRCVLAASSEYFRSLLFNGMRETSDDTIELGDTDSDAFLPVLRFIYTGRINLGILEARLSANEKFEDVQQVIGILGLAHRYGLGELESAVCDHLKTVLVTRNCCEIYEAAHLYSCESLSEVCLKFADCQASVVLSNAGFLQLSPTAVEKLISRRTFCAPEIDIFNAVQNWITEQGVSGQLTAPIRSVIAAVRLPLLSRETLLTVVRPSGLVEADAILDAITQLDQHQQRSNRLPYRYHSEPVENVALEVAGARVTNGVNPKNLLNGHFTGGITYTYHNLNFKVGSIEVRLSHPYMLSSMRLLLAEYNNGAYSYFIEVSMDGENWTMVVDKRQEVCRSWQRLTFDPQPVQFIRITGTHCSDSDDMFTCVHFECPAQVPA